MTTKRDEKTSQRPDQTQGQPGEGGDAARHEEQKRAQAEDPTYQPESGSPRPDPSPRQPGDDEDDE